MLARQINLFTCVSVLCEVYVGRESQYIRKPHGPWIGNFCHVVDRSYPRYGKGGFIQAVFCSDNTLGRVCTGKAKARKAAMGYER
jgi:hypothetical protein